MSLEAAGFLLQGEEMSKNKSIYCDTKVLEKHWFNWLVATATPELERYRGLGVLWTKPLDTVKDKEGNEITKYKKPIVSPISERRSHCLAVGHPIHFASDGDECDKMGTVTINGKQKKINLAKIHLTLTLTSDSWIHNFENPFSQHDCIHSLVEDGYIKENPTEESWHGMLKMISDMCIGIARNFHQPTEGDQLELANEALLQVSRKLVRRKLVYIPGKAPVFNLLTTTIHRCMYSIMNKRTNRRQGHAKLLEDAKKGNLPRSNRSLRSLDTPNLIKTH